MKVVNIKSILSLVCVFLFLGCEDETGPAAPDLLDAYPYTQQDSLEAYDFALWYDATLTPSLARIDTLLYVLAHLRASFGDSTEVLNENRFMLPWIAGQVLVGFSDSARVEIINNTYTGFELLPDHLHNYVQDGPDQLGASLFEYDSLYHPWRLAEYFRQLPGVQFAEPNGIMFSGGTFPISAGYSNEELTLLFVENYSYLPSAIHYYRIQGLQPELIGVWSPLWVDTPDWWESVLPVWQGFSTWGQ